LFRQVTTESSVWIIDEGAQRFYRMPIGEKPNGHPYQYSGDWEEYTELRISPFWGGRWNALFFTRPDGRTTRTGPIVSDTGSNRIESEHVSCTIPLKSRTGPEGAS
jgi:hypothetical protein